MTAAKNVGIPMSMLSIALKNESGKVGQIRRNDNGTNDYGPMQINTVRILDLKKKGLTVDNTRLRWDGCYNVAVGAWILSYEHYHMMVEHPHLNEPERFWTTLGNYHSRTPAHRNEYIRRAIRSAKEIMSRTGWRKLLFHINAGFPKSKRRR